MVPYSAWEGQPGSQARTELLQGKRSSCELSCLTWGTLILRSPELSCRSSLLAGNSCPIKRTQEWARPRVILWFSFKSLLGATSHPTSGELGGVIQCRVRETRDDGWKLETKNNVWDAQSPGSAPWVKATSPRLPGRVTSRLTLTPPPGRAELHRVPREHALHGAFLFIGGLQLVLSVRTTPSTRHRWEKSGLKLGPYSPVSPWESLESTCTQPSTEN